MSILDKISKIIKLKYQANGISTEDPNELDHRTYPI